MTYLNREFRVLTEQQLQRVHALTLEVLERKGILFHSEEARGILEAHGARVDGECVRLSPSQVDDALAQCPPRFLWQARDSHKSLLVGDGQDGVLVMQDHGPVFVQERAGTRRLGTLDDAVNFYKLGQTRPSPASWASVRWTRMNWTTRPSSTSASPMSCCGIRTSPSFPGRR